jgi:uncharacterized protein
MASQFEWDDDKADRNFRNHHVSFEEAATVFNDRDAITLADMLHSEKEERYIDIGMSSQGRLLFVVYTERGQNTRIISARPCTTKEVKIYARI